MMTRSACYPKRALFHPGRNQGFVLTDCSGLKNISFIDIPLSPYGLPAAKSTLDSFSRMLPPTHFYFLTRTFHSMRISAFSDISLCASFTYSMFHFIRTIPHSISAFMPSSSSAVISSSFIISSCDRDSFGL